MKYTKKQLKAAIINEVAKEYRDRISNLEEENRRLRGEYWKMRENYYAMERKNETLIEEVNKYKDWIERLQDFANLSEHERNLILKEAEVKFESDKAMNGIFRLFRPYFG